MRRRRLLPPPRHHPARRSRRGLRIAGHRRVEDAETQGAFALTWDAHGLRYGIPAEADAAVRAGRVVVANVSRAVLDQLAERYERLVVVLITVSDEVRAERLRSRGREADHDIARRLERADPVRQRAADHVIRNDGTIPAAGAHLLSIIDAARSTREKTG